MREYQKILTIVGPTGTGKTSLGIEVAHLLEASLLSADSRQVYQGLDVSTNKQPVKTPLKAKKSTGCWILDGVSVFGYDEVTPCEPFSVEQFLKKGMQSYSTILEKQQLPIIVGGTGFYIDSLLGLSPYSTVNVDDQLREKLRSLPLAELQHVLETKDKLAYQHMDAAERQNKRRLIRYIELAEGAGSVATATKWSPLKEQPLSILWIGLTAERKFLYDKADQWVDKLMNAPEFFEEIRSLKKLTCSHAQKVLDGFIFKEASEYLDNNLSFAEMREQIMFGMHKYIRRQLIWFRRNPQIQWFDVADPGYKEEALHAIKVWYDDRSSETYDKARD